MRLRQMEITCKVKKRILRYLTFGIDIATAFLRIAQTRNNNIK